MSLLTIIQNVAPLLGIPTPSVVVGSTDVQVQQLLALANEEGNELARLPDKAWRILIEQHTFTTVADDVQPDGLPDDLQGIVANSMFNRTTQREMIGPITPQQWQAIMAQPQLNRVFLAWRIRGEDFLITPEPTAGDTVAYEYSTINWAESVVGDPKEEFDADTDVPRMAPWLFPLGIRWRWRKTKGLDYAEDFRTYEVMKSNALGKDGGATKLDITGRTAYNVFSNVPIGNWPG